MDDHVQYDWKKIEKIVGQLTTMMEKKFPHQGMTVSIVLWQDNTYRITCRSGGNVLRDFVWYDGKVTYSEKQCSSCEVLDYTERPYEV